jgi:hypothetical protein
MEVVSVSGPHDDFIPVGDGQPQDAVSSEHFILQSLLSSRVETGMSNENIPDEEDVNVYLTHLVCDWIDPRRQLHRASYLRDFDHETFEQVQRAATAGHAMPVAWLSRCRRCRATSTSDRHWHDRPYT